MLPTLIKPGDVVSGYNSPLNKNTLLMEVEDVTDGYVNGVAIHPPHLKGVNYGFLSTLLRVLSKREYEPLLENANAACKK